MLGIEVHDGPHAAGEIQDRFQALHGLAHAILNGKRAELRSQGSGLHTEMDTRKRAELIMLEQWTGRPCWRRGHQCLQRLHDAQRIGVGFGQRDCLLAQHVQGGRKPVLPQSSQPGDHLLGIFANDELAGHLRDTLAGHRRCHSMTQPRNGVGQSQTGSHHCRTGGRPHILIELTPRVGGATTGRQHIYKAKQANLELRSLGGKIHGRTGGSHGRPETADGTWPGGRHEMAN